MKLKKALVLLAGAMTFTFAACSNNSTPEATTNNNITDPTPSQEASYLSFISDNKIRVDIMNNDLGVTFNYGNEAVVSQKEMTITSGLTLAYSGTLAVDKLNVISVVQTETGSTFAVNGGLDAEYISEFLAGKKFTNAKKVYVAISSGDINWTKGLNTDMDTKINTYILKK